MDSRPAIRALATPPVPDSPPNPPLKVLKRVHASPVALDGNGAPSIGNPALRMAVGLNNPTDFPFENPNYRAGGGHYVLRSGHLQMLSAAHWDHWNTYDSAYRLAIDQCASPGAGAW